MHQALLGGASHRRVDAALARAVLEALPDALVIADSEGRVTYINEKCAQLFGYAPSEVIGKPIELLVPERLREVQREFHEEYTRSSTVRPTSTVSSLVGYRRGGSMFRVDVSLSPVRTPSELLLLATVRDATERERGAAILRESEERFRLAFECAPIGMALVDLSGRFLRVNAAFSRIVHYAPDELVARRFQDITHPDDLAADEALAAKLVSGEIPRYQLAKRYVRKDGSHVHVMLNGSLLRDDNGAPLYFLAQVEDITARVQAGAAVRESETNFRELIEKAAEPIFVADTSGRYTQVNTAGCRLLGYAEHELVGKTIADIIPPEDVPRLAKAREYLMTEDRVQVAEWAVIRKDGQRVPVEVSTNIHGNRWVAFVRDLTERKRNELGLRRAQESLARAQRIAHVGNWEWDVRTNHVERSDEIFAIFGLRPGAAPDVRWSMSPYIHPEDRERVGAVVDAAAYDARAYTLEHRIVRADGGERVVLQHGEPIVENGQTVRVVGTLLDITEQRRAEADREALLTWLHAVVEHSPIAMLLLHGAKGERIEANERATTLLGRTLDHAGECADVFLDDAGAPLANAQLPTLRALSGEQIESAEYVVRDASGKRIPVLAAATPIEDADGRVNGAVVVFQDISAAKELERLRAEWGSVVAHDLRQPLATIVLSAQLLLRKGSPDTAPTVERVRTAAIRLKRMVEDLMDLSRLDAHRLELARRSVELLPLVRDCIDRSRLEAPTRTIELHTGGQIPAVVCDPDRVAQIFDNLLSNALKYSTPGSPIDVGIEHAGAEVRVAVTNEGRGIAPEDMPNMFRRFQRTESATKSGIKGVGLGLYITRELVEAHGGRLSVESELDKTTTFRFTLPIG